MLADFRFKFARRPKVTRFRLGQNCQGGFTPAARSKRFVLFYYDESTGRPQQYHARNRQDPALRARHGAGPSSSTHHLPAARFARSPHAGSANHAVADVDAAMAWAAATHTIDLTPPRANNLHPPTVARCSMSHPLCLCNGLGTLLLRRRDPGHPRRRCHAPHIRTSCVVPARGRASPTSARPP